MSKKTREKPVIGWREWVSLPELGVHSIKAKIDTGARSSSLHAFGVEIIRRGHRDLVRFGVHPIQRDSRTEVLAEAPLVDVRPVRSSTGHRSMRPVILTLIQILGQSWPIEITLANRDEMGFRMLLGRQAIRNRFLVDAGRSFHGGRPPRRKRRKKKIEK